MCADEIIDEMQARVDNFGQILTSAIQKESFGDSKKAIEILARREQITIAYENILTDLYQHRYQIKDSQKNQRKVTSFFLTKKNTSKSLLIK